MTTTPFLTASDLALTPQQVEQFHAEGFLAPLRALEPREMESLRPRIEAVLAQDPPDHKSPLHNRHLDSPLVWDLATSPAIIAAMKSVAGEDLLLWRTNFFRKDPGDREIPWHQDRNYWPLEPEIVVSAWIAIDPSTVENSCVQVLPGTHRRIVPHVKAPPTMVFRQMADPEAVDLSNKVDVELEPGQFMLFNERTMHHSEPNRSGRRRIGLAIRVIIPMVRVLEFDSPNHRIMQISGEDRLGFNPHVDPPMEGASSRDQ